MAKPQVFHRQANILRHKNLTFCTLLKQTIEADTLLLLAIQVVEITLLFVKCLLYGKYVNGVIHLELYSVWFEQCTRVTLLYSVLVDHLTSDLPTSYLPTCHIFQTLLPQVPERVEVKMGVRTFWRFIVLKHQFVTNVTYWALSTRSHQLNERKKERKWVIIVL